MFTKIFWVDAFERSVKSFAQGALTGLVGAQFIQQISAPEVLGAGALMAVFSLLTSVGSVKVGEDKESASLL